MRPRPRCASRSPTSGIGVWWRWGKDVCMGATQVGWRGIEWQGPRDGDHCIEVNNHQATKRRRLTRAASLNNR